MQSEFVLLDAKLNEKAKNLELAEEQIWRYFAEWQGMTFDGEIEYPKAFHFRDKSLDIDILKKAADTNPADPRVKAAIDSKILDLLGVDETLLKTTVNPNIQKNTGAAAEVTVTGEDEDVELEIEDANS